MYLNAALSVFLDLSEVKVQTYSFKELTITTIIYYEKHSKDNLFKELQV